LSKERIVEHLMSARLSDRRCLITAAGAGIGRAGAVAFAREGARVLATDIDSAALHSLASEHPSIRTAVLDVTNSQQIAALVADQGPFDVLFNCAGYVHTGAILDTDDAAWTRSFAVNVDAMFSNLCKAVSFPGNRLRSGGGRGKAFVQWAVGGPQSGEGVAPPNRFWSRF